MMTVRRKKRIQNPAYRSVLEKCGKRVRDTRAFDVFLLINPARYEAF